MNNPIKLLGLCFLLAPSISASSLKNSTPNTSFQINRMVLRNWWKDARENDGNSVNKMWENEKFSEDLHGIIFRYSYIPPDFLRKPGDDWNRKWDCRSNVGIRKKIIFENSNKTDIIFDFTLKGYADKTISLKASFTNENGLKSFGIEILDKKRARFSKHTNECWHYSCLGSEMVPFLKILEEYYQFAPKDKTVLDNIIQEYA